jgi:hypothetical protein
LSLRWKHTTIFPWCSSCRWWDFSAFIIMSQSFLILICLSIFYHFYLSYLSYLFIHHIYLYIIYHIYLSSYLLTYLSLSFICITLFLFF